MPVFSEQIHRNIYVAGLIILAASLPFSVFGMSVSQLIILGNWILEANFKTKLSYLKNKKVVFVFMSIFLIHLFWLFPPQDYHYALNDLRIKVPLLVLPFLIVTSKPLKENILKNILLVFALSVFIASCVSLFIYLKSNVSNITNYRELSVFISHIRFSLMVVMSVFILFYYNFINKSLSRKRWEKIVGIIIMIWLFFFLFLLKSLTGLFVFVFVSYFLIWFFSVKIKHWIKWPVILLLIVLPVLPVIYVSNILKKFTHIEEINFSIVEFKTNLGNNYEFYPLDNSVENGNRVWVYYCGKEIKSEWQKRSAIDFNGKDKNGNDIKTTLVRFLTSKGLRKDSIGVSKLSDNEIKAIENGVPNFTFLSEWKIYPLVYNAIWELYEYKNNNNATGHSIAQRIEYLKAAKEIVRNNFMTGVGTGNVQISFDNEYNKSNSQLDTKWRLRAHNQFITFLITFGIFGLIWIVFALFYPFIKQKGYKNFLFMVFFFIAVLSFFNEDTLETQAGITFFVFFYSILLFSKENPVVQKEQ